MKKLLCLLLSLLMVLPCTACANNGDDTDTTPDSGDATEAGTQEFFPAVKSAKYDETFQMIAIQRPAGEWYYAEELTNEVLNDAVYTMNQTVNNYLGVTIQYENISSVTTGGEVFSTVSPTIQAGDDAYQCCILHPYYSYNSFIGQNYAYDFYELSSLDLEQSYWNKSVIDSLAINDNAYIALGDFCSYTLNILYVNKNLMKNAGRDMPYDKVRNGSWTQDEFFALTQGLYIDNDGDGKRNNSDIYGFTGMWDANGSAMLQAADIYVATRNEDGMFELSLEGDRLVDFYEKLFNWSKDESTYIWDYGNKANSEKIAAFLDGHGYFTLESLGIQNLSADFDVGILPLPKYDKNQENYKHVNWGNNIVVPTSIKDPSMVGDVLEMMAYYSRTIVQEAYYDTVLQYKVSNAPDDREMVELIYDTVTYDPGIAFCDGNSGLWNLVYLACFGLTQNKPKIASYLKSNSRTAQKGLDDLFKDK